ncbi:carboxymuconolactone decarboxylase family protein [Pimelobacter simplex]|uniref:carboxymuconolactone decarboxylase family protein n=1 Tax=Nocardioides simplex TaxID=2045 RepID=UPI00214F9EEB|nr:carboxymuconolactone decarboxylase family protein [Pimelobacter simplex]UUW92262.1 carboxymuconolactone decarboxylase family protein [Pimelobacter simplex]UUW96089.1 carboxymuconolactone decarboxylase family protein [Pimelobacter simplex]
MTRTPIRDASPETYQALLVLDGRLKKSLGPVLYDLVKLRASQLNGCAYCVDMHATDLERRRVPTRKIHGVGAWQESPFFEPEERVALAFAETLTGGIGAVDDELWAEAGRLLGEERRADLIVAVGAINTWNMAGVTTHLQPEGALVEA